MNALNNFLRTHTVEASAPCRIDCGGTLDIKTFYYPLRHLAPCTFNIALNLRTQVSLRPYNAGWIKATSKGFESEAYPTGKAPFDSPMGLIFAIAACFQLDGVEIDIASASPPKSALGGSSTAAVALIGALFMVLNGQVDQKKTVLLAHAVEEAVARVPCGIQDQLAAAYGGIHAWDWPSDPSEAPFKGREILTKEDHSELERHLLIAYCGVPHESSDINGKWVRAFLSGQNRELWEKIVRETKAFVKALSVKDWTTAVQAVNNEVEVRRAMTPEVFDDLGNTLLETSLRAGCGARFAGAGGGGCIWSIGPSKNIRTLRTSWEKVLASRKEAELLDVGIDSKGLEVTCY